MRHQLGLMSGVRYACLLVGSRSSGFPISRPKYAKLRVRPVPVLFSAAVRCRVVVAVSRTLEHGTDHVMQRTPYIVFAGHRLYSLSLPSIVLSLSRTRFAASQRAASAGGAEDLNWGASRSEIRETFWARAARFILSNTPASVLLGDDAGGYADATLRGTHGRNWVRNFSVRRTRERKTGVRSTSVRNSGVRLRNATALGTQLTQRLLEGFRLAERTLVDNLWKEC